MNKRLKKKRNDKYDSIKKMTKFFIITERCCLYHCYNKKRFRMHNYSREAAKNYIDRYKEN